ncbi:hypothetical protein DMC25_12585, partial [Caulobacter sp. D4A]|uniref:FecR/PupR family sigma factor regulator n=1 Tax=Caulobacter sp. D4A TaxID=2204171 RepID=UPI000D8E859D
MNAAVDPDSPIGREARAWVLAVLGEPFPPERSARLRAWLDADPQHVRAYEEAEALMLALGQVQALARPLPPRVPTRWIAAGAALAACL